jgi:hypothetical protein
MNVVAHRVPFQHPNAFLFTQIPKDLSCCRSKFSIDHFPAVFGNENHVILAFPSYMCQTLKILHTLFLLPNRAFPESERMLFQGTPERLSPQGRTAVGRGFMTY